MQACGYCVPEKKERQKSDRVTVPLINPTQEEAERLQALWNERAQNKYVAKYPGMVMKLNRVKRIEQARYSANSKGSYTPFDTMELDENGQRVWSSYKGKSATPVCRIRTFSGGDASLSAPRSIVVISDKPAKALPIDWEKATQEQKEES